MNSLVDPQRYAVTVVGVDPDNVTGTITVPVDQVNVSAVQLPANEGHWIPNVLLQWAPERLVAGNLLQANVGV